MKVKDELGRFVKQDVHGLFWKKVDTESTPDGCWEWTAAKSDSGYGAFRFQGRMRRAHCVSWEIAYGEIPNQPQSSQRMLVCHKCDNPACCRPSHLFLGTSKDNTRDMCTKGRCGGWKNRGAANHNALLTEAQAAEILEHPEIRLIDFARRFSVAISTVSSVRSRKSWTYLG